MRGDNIGLQWRGSGTLSGIRGEYLFLQRRYRGHPTIYSAVRARLSFFYSSNCVDFEIVQQRWFVELKVGRPVETSHEIWT